MPSYNSASSDNAGTSATAPRRWHLFCRVVDNYGDIGVCWRLARQLLLEHGREVTLWVDDLTSFHAIMPAVDVISARQAVAGVTVRHWEEALPPLTSADVGEVVIEAFGCELPSAYIELMRVTHPLWINLEYLSAEEWVERCHGAPSPRHGLKKFFFFPGFTPATGGLLWEAELIARLEGHDASALPLLMQELGVVGEIPAADCHISLFAYENPALAALLDTLSRHPGRVQLLVPQGRISEAVGAWLGETLPIGVSTRRDNLAVTAIPFMSQPQYDRLLAACDLNFVRGEDSFVRTQMLGRPFVWHIYPQEEGTHLVKLEAFLQRYVEGMPAELATQVLALHRAWNAAPHSGMAEWEILLPHLPLWQAHARAWQARLQRQGDLASNLVLFSTVQV